MERRPRPGPPPYPGSGLITPWAQVLYTLTAAATARWGAAATAASRPTTGRPTAARGVARSTSTSRQDAARADIHLLDGPVGRLRGQADLTRVVDQHFKSHTAPGRL